LTQTHRADIIGPCLRLSVDRFEQRTIRHHLRPPNATMPEEVEIETRDLQETIEELQEERKERAQEERRNAWTRYIALTTAILAVFAAVAALQSGSLINESMMDQLRASDKWNEYQAARQKEHVYAIQAHQLLDRGVKLSPAATEKGRQRPDRGSSRSSGPHSASAGAAVSLSSEQKADHTEWKAMPPSARLRQYIAQAEKENDKESDLQSEARKLEQESDHKAHRHHQFASAVALIQVAISLSAVAALTRMKSVWWLSVAVGLAGIAFFIMGSVGLP
jgi:Domain of unknown function (DUF4337)